MAVNQSEQFWKSLPKEIHTDELEAITNLTRQRLWQMHSAGSIPTPRRGWFPFRDTIQALLRYYREKNEGSINRSDAKVRREEAEAAMAENELAKELMELVPVVELAERMQIPMVAIRKEILNSDLDKERKDEILLKLQKLYGSIFGERILSKKVKKVIQEKGIKV